MAIMPFMNQMISPLRRSYNFSLNLPGVTTQTVIYEWCQAEEELYLLEEEAKRHKRKKRKKKRSKSSEDVQVRFDDIS